MENWNYHSIPNEFGFANGIKVIPAIHDSKSYLTKITFFDCNATLANEFQTESKESKVAHNSTKGEQLMKMLPVLIVIYVFFTFTSFGLAEAAVTASANFCEAFPTNSECTGWRVEPIYDNFWFCTYVDLPTMCKNAPDPQKQIPTLSADHCCRLFDDELVSLRDVSMLYYDPSFLQMMNRGLILDESYPVNELTIWTDKDHYNFGDRINVYGKFDFGDPIIKKSNLFVNVIFNGEIIIRDLPVRDNGWFAGFSFLDNPRYDTDRIEYSKRFLCSHSNIGKCLPSRYCHISIYYG